MANTHLSASTNLNEPIKTSSILDLINIFSRSGKEFAAEPSTLSELGERFRAAQFQLSDMTTAFLGAGEALYYLIMTSQGQPESNIPTPGGQSSRPI